MRGDGEQKARCKEGWRRERHDGGKGAVLCIDDGFIHLSVRFTADSE